MAGKTGGRAKGIVLRSMKKAVTLGMPIVLTGCFGCTYVPPGYVGVKVNLYGNQRGVSDYPIVTGRVLYNPWTTNIDTFPTFMQYRVWTKDPKEGGTADDQSITFVSNDKIQVNVDVSVAYMFESAKVPELYVTFRQDPDTIADTYIRSRVRDAFVKKGSTLTAMEILGGGIGTLDADVTEMVNSEMSSMGIHFDYISVIGRPRIPDQIQQAINAAIESTQQAAQARNQVAVVKADADQAVAEATGKANAVIAQAQGDANAILAKATAQAKANQMLASSLTPELVDLKRIEKWDGAFPITMMGGSTPNLLLNLEVPTSK
jgi:regulator of protease activity HflC (stomatin/prohibitin superfamily)